MEYNKNGGKKKKNKVRYASGIADKTTNERDDVSVSEAVTSLELDSQAKEIIDNYETIKENNDSNESSGSISSGSFIKKQKKIQKKHNLRTGDGHKKVQTLHFDRDYAITSLEEDNVSRESKSTNNDNSYSVEQFSSTKNYM